MGPDSVKASWDPITTKSGFQVRYQLFDSKYDYLKVYTEIAAAYMSRNVLGNSVDPDSWSILLPTVLYNAQQCLTLLHSERPKLYTIALSAELPCF